MNREKNRLKIKLACPNDQTSWSVASACTISRYYLIHVLFYRVQVNNNRAYMLGKLIPTSRKLYQMTLARQ